MCILKNPLTGQPLIDYDDPPTCCPDCEQDFEMKKAKQMRENAQNNELYKMQISQLTGIVSFNNSVIVNLIQNQTYMMNHVEELENMVFKLKSQLNSKTVPKQLSFNQDDKKDRLINILFNNKSFAYSITLSEDFESQLFKEKNFNLRLQLIDSQNNSISNCNPIPICLRVYSSQLNNPQPIETNKSGLQLIKGNTQTELYHGKAQFNKLHLREVTSSFLNGWVYFVIYAKTPSFNYTSSKSEFDLQVDYSQIKPLVISQVCVRAKPKRKL